MNFNEAAPPPLDRRPTIALAPGGPKTEYAEEFRVPFTMTLPPQTLGESVKPEKVDENIDKYVTEYSEHLGKHEEKSEAVKGMTTKLLLLLFIIAAAIATAPFTGGGSLIVAAIMWGGAGASGLALLGAGAYLGVTKYHEGQMKAIVEKLRKVGFDEGAVKELALLKLQLEALSTNAKDAHKVVKDLSNKVKKFVSKMSLQELNEMGISDDRLKEISVRAKMHRLNKDPQKNQKEIEKLGLLLANAKETDAAKKCPQDGQTEVVENFELFRAAEKPDSVMPITGKALRDPVRYQRRNLQHAQNDLMETIVQEGDRINALNSRIEQTEKEYDSKKQAFIQDVLATHVTKLYLGFGNIPQ